MAKRKVMAEPWMKHVGREVKIMQGNHVGKTGVITGGWYDTVEVDTGSEILKGIPTFYLKSLCNLPQNVPAADTSEQPILTT